MTDAPLGGLIAPCGPVVDNAAAVRAHERLGELAVRDGWSDRLEAAWPALAPVFSASPYLTNLGRRRPDSVRQVLADRPEDCLAVLLAADDLTEARLRELKAETHLLTALADLGGVWELESVTGALTAFADKAVQAAFEIAAREAVAAGRLVRAADDGDGFVRGLFCIAMGKHGAGELNYSSDIDISIFFDPAALTLAPKVEAQAFATRFTDRVAEILQRRTADGYVFRVDLRLRPDPSSTPAAVSLPAAYGYYESVGQNWERAAFIKARVIAGDNQLGETFLANLQPFIWRRNLDFAAIADIHSIKRQIHAHKVDDRLTAAGADLKLGRGGIREIEFFVQTQQLILGGRQPELRTRGTLETLATLTRLGHVAPRDAEILGRRLSPAPRARTPRSDDRRRADPPAAGKPRGQKVGRRPCGLCSTAVFRRCRRTDAEKRQCDLRRAVRRRGSAVVQAWQSRLHRCRGRSGNARDARPDGVHRRGAGRGGYPPLAPRSHSRDPHRARPRAVHTPCTPTARRHRGDRRARHRVRPLRRLLRRRFGGGPATVIAAGSTETSRPARARHGLRAGVRQDLVEAAGSARRPARSQLFRSGGCGSGRRGAT